MIDGGWFNKRRRQRDLERTMARFADVWAQPSDVVDEAIGQLAEGLDEGHVPLSNDPRKLRAELIELNTAGIAVVGIGPYGPNAFLRGAVRWKA